MGKPLDFWFTSNDSTNFEPFQLNLNPGIYLLEVWGAKGGDGHYGDTLKPGGNGGYSKGVLKINKTTKIFIYLGGKGQSIQDPIKILGGYNGGGYNYDVNTQGKKSSGGGGTDIRINGNSLYHRVIVAGGGGGGNAGSSYGYADGGAGGGEEGCKSPGHYSSNLNYHGDKADGSGGTQTDGGKMGIYHNKNERNIAPQPNGTFGYGGNIEADNALAGAGGGGWYGGGAGNGHDGAGGGGSGFVLNETTFVYVPKNYQLDSKYFLKNALTIDGNHSIPSFQEPGKSMIGNPDNGHARITLLENYTAIAYTPLYSSPKSKTYFQRFLFL